MWTGSTDSLKRFDSKESVHFMNPPTTRGLAGDKIFCQYLGHKFQSVRRTKILYYFEYFTSHIWTFIVFFFSMELNNVRLYLKHISFNSRHTFEQLVNILGVKTISLALLWATWKLFSFFDERFIKTPPPWATVLSFVSTGPN